MQSDHFHAIILSAMMAAIPLAKPVAAQAAAGQATSVAIVELFTSEGCSSCPPADSLLRQVNLKRGPAGQLIVGISEHVTYWNGLGWKDPYAAQVFTDRQAGYVSRLAAEGSYTPQMVVNGQTEFVGSNAAALDHALRAHESKEPVELKVLSSTVQGGNLHLQFTLSGTVKRALDIVAVVVDDSDRSYVLHGENSGKSLQHVSVARVLQRVATVSGPTQQIAQLPVPANLNLGDRLSHHLILFAQEKGQGAILGATILPL